MVSSRATPGGPYPGSVILTSKSRETAGVPVARCRSDGQCTPRLRIDQMTKIKAQLRVPASADDESPATSRRALFPVVGIGASAGGLAATTELVRRLGPRPGVAVVVIHHLDRNHDSTLANILSRATEMPVQAAVNGQKVQPNHIYVVLPNVDLALTGGALRVTPRVDGGGLHLPIDRFFQSLALDGEVLAIGVLLSGTGSDGTLGVEAIKAEAGVTFAQDGSAEHVGMPESAIATGCVDFVLPVQAIAEELIRIGERPAQGAQRSTAADDETQFRLILAALHKASGVDFASYKHSTLRRRIQRRVWLHRLPGLREYAALLEGDPAEASALSEEVLIHVTGFFRDPEVFEALKTQVFPRVIQLRPKRTAIRIWVPGCSTGEEVYSLAICLLEFLRDSNAADTPIKLFGTDISAKAIEAARAGRYAESVEQEVSAGRLQAYFLRAGGLYQIRKDIRDLCVFAKHDATRDPPFSGMDLISCRNLMIYLGPTLQDRLLPILHYALKEPGFLVLGTSETTRNFPGFSALDPKHKLYTRTAVPRRLPLDFTVSSLPDPTLPVAAPTLGSSPLDAYREADRLVLAQFAPAGVVVTDDLVIIQFRGKTGAYLEPASGVATFDLLRMAREELRVPLRQAIDQARTERAITRKTGVFLAAKPSPRSVDIEVIPFTVPSTQLRCFIVLFGEQARSATSIETSRADSPLPIEAPLGPELRNELASTRDYLQSVIEQLEAGNEEQKAANEEITSSNEELRSTNEELQITKEELQATNEELLTVNEEMIVRNAETTRVNDDLSNVLTSAEIPIVLLGGDLRIRRFTPAAGQAFRFVPTDISRPIAEVGGALAKKMAQISAQVVEQMRPERADMQDETGRWFAIAARPYITLDRRIEGTVVTAIDIDELTKAAERVAEARAYAESIVDTVGGGLLVLDRQSRVRSANRGFHKLFGTTPQQVEGHVLGELGQGELNDEGLSKRIRELSEGTVLEGLRLERHLPGVGLRVLLLNGRLMRQSELVLLAIEDQTTRVRAEQALAQTELEFRNVLSYAPAPIITVDAVGCVFFANEAACKLFGFEPGSLPGISFEQLVPETARADHPLHRAKCFASSSPRTMGRDSQIRGRRRNGTEFLMEVMQSHMVSEGTELVVFFLTDLTDREKAEQEKIRGYQEKLQQMAFEAARVEQRERRRIAVELHDHIGQALALAKIKLEATRETLSAEPRRVVDEVVQLVEQSIVDTRSLTFELSPPILYDLGLKPALSWLVEDVEKRCGIVVELEADDEPVPLDDERAALIFRAVRELLMNVVKHAKSPTAKVIVRRQGENVLIGVQDDGVGFDVDTSTWQGPPGFGLFSLREQISRLGGTVEIASGAHAGTRVSLRVPLLHPVGSDAQSDGLRSETA